MAPKKRKGWPSVCPCRFHARGHKRSRQPFLRITRELGQACRLCRFRRERCGSELSRACGSRLRGPPGLLAWRRLRAYARLFSPPRSPTLQTPRRPPPLLPLHLRRLLSPPTRLRLTRPSMLFRSVGKVCARSRSALDLNRASCSFGSTDHCPVASGRNTGDIPAAAPS